MYIIDFGLFPTPLAWFAFLNSFYMSWSGAGWVGVLALFNFILNWTKVQAGLVVS